LLSRDERGTPMGEVFRRLWLPEVTMPGSGRPGWGAPCAGEIADSGRGPWWPHGKQGRAGVGWEDCSHRLAPLLLGPQETNEAMRCPVHVDV